MTRSENRKLMISDDLKKMTQLLLVSVSVLFSLLLSSSNHSFFGPDHSLLRYFNYFYLSRLPLRLFTHTLDKNCIFLLCNGLLVFVAKYSGGLITSSSTYSTDHHHEYYDELDLLMTTSESNILPPQVLLEDELVEINAADDQDVHENRLAVVELEDKENECMKNNIIGLTEDTELISTEELIVEEDGGGKESGFLIIGKEGEHVVELSVQGQEFIEYSLNQEEEEEEGYYDDGEGNGVLISTQELNKKFEEFIRKMKEEIRIEAQQQLVMVN